MDLNIFHNVTGSIAFICMTCKNEKEKLKKIKVCGVHIKAIRAFNPDQYFSMVRKIWDISIVKHITIIFALYLPLSEHLFYICTIFSL